VNATDEIGALAQVVDRLEASGLPAWLDSGTLLGMTREGAFIESDPDLDLSVVAAGVEGPALVAWLRSRFAGWRMLTYHFRGRLSRIKMVPPAGNPQRRIDLMLLRPVDEMLVAHSTYRVEPEGLPARIVDTVRRSVRKAHAAVRGDIDVSLLHRWGVVTVGTWILPSELVLPVTKEPRFGLPVPARTEDYLAYRYGDWRTPSTDWIYWRDDGAFRKRIEC
jgi:hypothetical protein